MVYISPADLYQRLGAALYARLTDRVNGHTADEEVALTIVQEAEAEADGYLAVRYVTPVDVQAYPAAGDSLRPRVLDLAESIAWRASPFVCDLPTRVDDLQAAARKWFDEAARGIVALAAPLLPAATAPPAGATPLHRGSARMFTTTGLDGL